MPSSARRAPDRRALVARDDPDAHGERLDGWLAYLDGLGIEAIARGAVILRRRSRSGNWTRRDRISLDRVEQAGGHILRVLDKQDHLEVLDDDRALLDEALALVDQHHLEQTLTGREGRAELRSTTLSLDEGLAFEVALDEHAARLVPLLDGERPLCAVLSRRAEEMKLGPDDAARFEAAALPVVRRLLELGLLERRDR